MEIWHSGVLTADVYETIDFLCAASGVSRDKWTIMDVDFPQSKMVSGDGGKLRAAFGRVGGAVVELLQPLDDKSYHAQALKTRGPGFHHNAYICGDDLDNVLDTLIARGGRVLWEFQDGDEHACYVEADGGSVVLELINICPFIPD